MPATTLDTRRPFTRAEAVAAGLDPRLLRGSRFRRIFRGVYVDASAAVDEVVRLRAALALHPEGAFVSHLSAARLFGLPVPPTPDVHVSVLRQQDRRSRAGLRSHVGGPDPRLVEHRGVRASHPLQMFVEVASSLSLVDLVVVGDALLRVFRLDADRLVSWCAASTDRHATAARAAAAFVRSEVDSPMESRLRMLIVLAGLPEPEVNHKIRDESGRVAIRLDLSYPRLKLIVEYDGRQHAQDTKQWQRDLERREFFDDEEWRILVVTAQGIFREPEQTLARIRKALVARGCAVPRRFDDAWRPHFPPR